MNVIKHLNDHKIVPTELGIKKLQHHFKSYNIKISYDMGLPIRLIFTSNKFYESKSNIYLAECNGLIVSYHSTQSDVRSDRSCSDVRSCSDTPMQDVIAGIWTILAQPPSTIKIQPDIKTIDKYLSTNNYDILEIDEGTIFTYYYYNGEWRMSTSNGIDVTNLIWDGKSYIRAFSECLEKKGINLDKFEKTLNKAAYYTFGFKHPHRHPFMENESPYKIWFVHGADIKTGIFAKCGIPMQKIVSDDAYNLHKKLFSAENNFMTTKKILYGYILRPKFLFGQSLILESKILTNIRNLYYRYDFNKNAQLLHMSRVKYILLYTYVTKQVDVFLLYFPQFKKYFKDCEKITLILTYKIWHILKMTHSKYKKIDEVFINRSIAEIKLDPEESKIYNIYAEKIINSMSTVLSTNLIQIRDIYGYVIGSQNIEMYDKLYKNELA